MKHYLILLDSFSNPIGDREFFKSYNEAKKEQKKRNSIELHTYGFRGIYGGNVWLKGEVTE